MRSSWFVAVSENKPLIRNLLSKKFAALIVQFIWRRLIQNALKYCQLIWSLAVIPTVQYKIPKMVDISIKIKILIVIFDC